MRDTSFQADPPLTPSREPGQSLLPASFNINTVFLGGLFVLALLWGCAAAAEIIVPIVVAFMLKLALQPLTGRLDRLRVPRPAAALLIIIMLVGIFAGVGVALSGPAGNWANELSAEIPKLQEKINSWRAPMKPIQNIFHGADSLAVGADSKTVTVAMEGSRPSEKFLTGTRNFLGSVFEMLLVLFFMLISGDLFLRRLVEVLPRFKDKKQAINISNQIESDIAAYLITITFMNAAVGIATACVMHFCGIRDPMLWGIVAFLLNYIPIAGPLVGIALFTGVGLISDGGLGNELLPAMLYLAIHLVEGEAVTPLLLARHFTLNPFLVILALVFWYWLWGIPGALLSTPMLAIFKIICDRIEALKPFGHFIEGEMRLPVPCSPEGGKETISQH
jgi:predicted PurR-regulated permease PerM